MINASNNAKTIFSSNYCQPILSVRDLLAGDLVGGNKPCYFRIPIYQRGYSWDIRQCFDLWKDIERLKNNKNSQNNFHFLGTLSLRLDPAHDNDYNLKNTNEVVYEVVDGQQRFTTLMIIICVLVNRLKQCDSNIRIEDYIGDENYRRFQYSCDMQSSVDYLEYRLYRQNSNYSTGNNLYFVNIDKAIEFYEDRGEYDRRFNYYCGKKNFPARHFGCNIKKLNQHEVHVFLDIILDNLKFNVSIVSQNYSVNTVFESMNNRGKFPTKLEILKNRLIYLTPNTNIHARINNVWSEIYKNIGIKSQPVLSDDEFLKCHWYMYYSSSKYSDEYTEQIFDEYFALEKISNNGIDKKITDYVESLKKAVPLWSFLNLSGHVANVNPDTNIYTPGINKYIDRLSRLVNINSYSHLKSFILALLYTYSDSNLKPTDLESILKIMESYIFIGGHMGDKKLAKIVLSSQKWSIWAHEIYLFNSQKNKNGIDQMIKSCIADMQDTIVKNIKAIMANFYDIKDKDLGYYAWSGCRYFLFEYDLYLSTLNRNQTPPNNLVWEENNSIEHILPETPTDRFNYWANAFRDYIKDKNAMKILTHSLGNLLPIGRDNNSSASNRDFYNKCNVAYNSKHFAYRNGNYSSIDVANNYGDHWTATQIAERLKKMMEFLFTEWLSQYTVNFRWTDIYDNLGISTLLPAVPSSIDPNLKNALDNIVNQIKNSNSVQHKTKQSKGMQVASRYSNLYNLLQPQLSIMGFIIDVTPRYLRFYKVNWHKRGSFNVHYQIEGNMFGLYCERKTPLSIIQALNGDVDVSKILYTYWSDYASGVYSNRLALNGFPDDSAVAACIMSVVQKTEGYISNLIP